MALETLQNEPEVFTFPYMKHKAEIRYDAEKNQLQLKIAGLLYESILRPRGIQDGVYRYKQEHYLLDDI